MKKFVLILLILLNCFHPISVYADSAPKPYVHMRIKGLSGKKYYVTLLSKADSTGPWSFDGEIIDGLSEDEKVVWEKMKNYQDDYYFLQYFQECTDTHQFEWNYYPPDEFKIMIYLYETDQMIVSQETYTRYAFDSSFIININIEKLSIKVQEDYYSYIFSFMSRLLLTLGIELFVAYYFKIKNKKQLTIIIFTNIFTQIILNILFGLIEQTMLYVLGIIGYALIEILVIGIEYRLYKKYLPCYGECTFQQLFNYTVFANILSCFIGFICLK